MAQDPQLIAQMWVRGIQQSGEKTKAGINAVTEAPGQKAAASADLWLQRLNESRDKYTENSRAVTLEEWRRSILEKGVPRMGQGAAAAQQKMANFLTWLLPKTEEISRRVQQMPKGNLQASAARMLANMEAMAQLKYKRGR